MKKVLQIFQRDLKRLLRSPAAALVMVGVCILPMHGSTLPPTWIPTAIQKM